jgi:isoleucyl-tRNA synthetase
VALGHAARSASEIRVRQPLAVLRLRRSGGGGLSEDQTVDRALTEQVLEELNVKRLELIPDESALIERTLRPLLPVIGPRRGSAVASIMAAARSGDWHQLEDGRVQAGSEVLEPDEFELIARARSGHELAEEGELLVALDTGLTPELEAEGLAREVGHRLQGLRKLAGYEISDRIAAVVAGDAGLVERLQGHRDWLAAELLADDLTMAPEAVLADADRTEELAIDGGRLRIAVRLA